MRLVRQSWLAFIAVLLVGLTPAMPANADEIPPAPGASIQ